jgi:exopolyphosphatase/guanosine-5'-triphosphate,3'-diphosphate pyrophosphatase
LAERYHTDKNHAARVKSTVAYLVGQAQSYCAFLADENCQQFLNWAAELHEIGHDIAHSQYHKHSAYITEHADLAGFSKQDQAFLATLIRSHRRKFSLSRFRGLHAPWNTYAACLAIILRLAVLLRRNRHEQDLPDFKLIIDSTKIDLQFPDNWLTQAPLTYADLIQEANYLKSAGFSLKFS